MAKQIPMLLEQHTEIVTGHNSTTVNEAWWNIVVVLLFNIIQNDWDW